VAMIKSIVIDTNAYSAFKRGEKDALEVIKDAEMIVFSPVVLGELMGGFGLGKRAAQNQQELQTFLERPKVLFMTINAQTSEEYAKIFQSLKTKGTPIPTNDMWIAAMAKQLEMAVFTYDAHFSKIEGLKIVRTIEDWE
jgi:tRNA(fMet)-specific endonuclease VapC